ncbi:Acyl carrier protein 1 [Dorcoceras hygrometricum]|nr:Acyl carrier protein 1 [Dorcoceras hygrometricum]
MLPTLCMLCTNAAYVMHEFLDRLCMLCANAAYDREASKKIKSSDGEVLEEFKTNTNYERGTSKKIKSSDSEINSHVSSNGIDGVITDFPATAARYRISSNNNLQRFEYPSFCIPRIYYAMASLASTLPAPPAATGNLRRLYPVPKATIACFHGTPRAIGIRRVPNIINQFPLTKSSGYHKRSRISCAVAQPETLQIVRSTIAKQLQVEEGNVTPQMKFADLGADSLDTVEIMMALEEQFSVSIGEGGAENIATVQDAADLIEKVKTAAA